MAYIRVGEDGTAVGFFGCGPGCPCASCRRTAGSVSRLGERYVPEEEETPLPPAQPAAPQAATLAGSPYLGNFGWDTQFLPFALREGHEAITRDAIPSDRTIRFTVGGAPRSRTLSVDDIRMIIRGNQDTDIQYLRRARSLAIPAIISPAIRPVVIANVMRYAIASFSPDEQKHHALRRTYGQSQAEARRDVVSDLLSQHAGILAETDWNKRLYRMGKVIHLIQDSFSPAHTVRRSEAGWCIDYIRNYGRGGLPIIGSDREHRVPSDERDQMARSATAASQAKTATRRYLPIVFKAIYGRDPRNPDAGQAAREAAEELNNFIIGHFRLC